MLVAGRHCIALAVESWSLCEILSLDDTRGLLIRSRRLDMVSKGNIPANSFVVAELPLGDFDAVN